MYKIKEYEDKYNKNVNDFVITILVDEYGFEQFREGIKKLNNRDYITNRGKIWIAIDDNDNVVGTIAVRKHNDTEAELNKFYVRKDYRGKGLSKELYGKVMETIKEVNCNRIFLGTYDKLNTAVNFYLRRGFTQIDEVEEKEEGARYFELYI